MEEIGASISLNSSMLLAVLNRSSFSFDAGCPAARWFAGSCAQAHGLLSRWNATWGHPNIVTLSHAPWKQKLC